MAKRKQRVQAGQSYATFPNPQEVMNLNPGVPTLSPGQTIWVPGSQQGQEPNNLFGPLVNNNGYRPPATTPANFNTANSFMSGGQVNTGAFNVGAPQIAPGLANQPEFTAPGGINSGAPPGSPVGGANSFQSGSTVNSQAGLQTLVNGSVAQPGQSSSPVPTSVTLPPNYVYTGGNDPLSVEQRRQWNIAAGGTGDERVFLMSREQRHAIGDARRRRRYGDGSANTSAVVAHVPQGNTINSALSWRVG